MIVTGRHIACPCQRCGRVLALVFPSHACSAPDDEHVRLPSEPSAIGLLEALNSILCLAFEGPEAFALEGKPLRDLVTTIEREASRALAAYRGSAGGAKP